LDKSDKSSDVSEPREGALRRVRDTSGICSRRYQVICPSGGFLTGLSSHFFGFSEKYLLPPDPNQF
jgi:hypothetical protein